MHVQQGLSEKQKRFSAEYTMDFNGTRAAKAAGYSERTANEQAARLLAKASVQNEIQQRIASRELAYKHLADEIVSRLMEIAVADVGDCFFMDESGMMHLKPLNKLPRAIHTMAISKGGDKIYIAMEDRVRALELLGKHFGIFDGNRQQDGDSSPGSRQVQLERLTYMFERLILIKHYPEEQKK